MKSILPILIFILAGFGNALSQELPDIHISGNFQNKLLADLLREIEEEHSITFFYRQEWLSGITVTKKFQDTPLKNVLEDILHENQLSCIVFNPYSVFILNEAPDPIEPSAEPIAVTPVETTTEQPENEIFVVGKSQNMARGGLATLSGFIREAETGAIPICGTFYAAHL
jgi:hypothetical protein